MRTYREVQWLSVWFCFLYAVVTISLGVMLFRADALPMAARVLFVVSLFFWLPFMSILRMETRLEDGILSVRFGWAVLSFYRRAFPVADIGEVRAVKYHQHLDFRGGRSICSGSFEGSSCRALIARGNRGVFLRADGVNWIIGSQEEQRLEQALKRELTANERQ